MPRGALKVPLLVEPGGAIQTVNPAAVPQGKLLSSSNFLTRRGVGRPRPGYEVLGTVAAADRVIGLAFWGSAATDANLYVHTLTAAYEWDGAAFNAVTGTWTASSEAQHVRFTSFTQGDTLYLIRVNEVNAPDEVSATGGAAFVDVAGSPPAARDITTTNGRVVLFAAGGNPRRVQWSGFNDRTSWAAGSINDLDETQGEIIAGRAFGPLSMGIYKEDSVYLGVAQAALAPFQFQKILDVSGPVSTAALVSGHGVHYWLADDNNIYQYDGNRVTIPPGGGDLAPLIQSTLDWANRRRTVGFLLEAGEPELWFVYPAVPSGTNTRAVCLNLITGAMSAHTFAHQITAGIAGGSRPGLTWDDLTGTWDTLSEQFATWDDLGSTATRIAFLGSSAGVVYRFNLGTVDDTEPIAWEFTHGWRAPAGPDGAFYLDGVRSLWTQTTTATTVTVGVTVTDDLSDADTETTATFTTTDASPHLLTFPNLRGTWVRVRHAASSATTELEHRGAQVLAWPRAQP